MNGSALRSQPITTYFNIRGRLEPVPLILEELGSAEWQAFKLKPPFGALSIYQEDDLST